MLRRKSDPIVPPSPEELEIIRAQKAEAKALLDAEREAKEAAEKAAKEAAEKASKEKPAASVTVE